MSDRAGRTAFFDCKSFQDTFFTYSDITQHQLQRLQLYSSFNLNAGFLVELRAAKTVVYFPSAIIAQAGPRSRFGAHHGNVIGTGLTMRLTAVLALTCPRP